ncbi:MAG TPA: hypothetical protein VHK88_15765 [Aquihabitans sp.]|nr:hypothetical protein [Aquihabitans sp.]
MPRNINDLSPTMQALYKLNAAGKADDALAAIRKHSDSLERVCKEIRNDNTRTESHKRWRMAVVSSQARLGTDHDLHRLAAGVTLTDRGDAARVFGVEGLPGDAATLVISRRDAADRVAKITDRNELRALLAQATRTGDEVLARAVAERAMAERDDKTLHAFCDDRPALDSAVERLWKSGAAEPGVPMELTMQLGALAPPELQGMSSGSIASLARQGAEVAS